jgi:hypothetical protein
MADRIPLIVNSSAGQIQELPSGDNLLLTNSNIAGVVNVTATGAVSAASATISGDLEVTGNITNNGNPITANTGTSGQQILMGILFGR